jgi:kynurenine formamidase
MARVEAELSRRGLLRVGLTAGAVAVAGTLAGRRTTMAQATPVATPVAVPSLAGFSAMVDLTHVVSPAFPVYPGTGQMEIESARTYATDGYYSNKLILNEHTGTHMDAPAHFIEGGLTAELIPIERLIAPLAVIDISSRAESDPDAQLIPDDILAWESANGPLPAGAFVAMYSGWEMRLPDAEAFINVDAGGVQHYPGIHPDAATLLVEERDIVGVGVDTLSQDFGASTDFATHVTILGAGKYGIEGIANLGALPPSGATVIVAGPKHIAASGGPSRLFALY